MNDQQRNTLLALGIALGMVSIPLVWFTADAVKVDGSLNILLNTIESAVGDVNKVEVSGREGRISFPVSTPIWLIVCIAIASGALQLMRSTDMFDIPTPALWLTAILSGVWIAGVLIYVVTTGKAVLGIGAFLGLVSGVVPLLCLLVPKSLDEAAPR